MPPPSSSSASLAKVAIAPRPDAFFRLVVFDLDEALLDRVPAWVYAIEQAVLSVTGKRVQPVTLAAEYHTRPWHHALEVLLSDRGDIERCAELSAAMFQRSALKRLLVHQGMGMALDRLRGARVEMGAVSHERHADALRQVQSTGLDRFLTILSATGEGEHWDVKERIEACLQFAEQSSARAAFVSHDARDLGAAAEMGLAPFAATWVAGAVAGFAAIPDPPGLEVLLAPVPPG